ncbi:MAG: ComEC/Rec2 family competence protein [Candidatus Onthomonas sp.]
MFLAVYLLSGWQELLLGALLLYVGLACCLRRNPGFALLCLGAVLGLWLSWYRTTSLRMLEQDYVGQTVELELQVREYPQVTAYGVSLEARVLTEGKLEGRTLTLWLPGGQDLRPGDRLSATVTLDTARDSQPEWQWYAWSQGISLEGEADWAVVSREGTPWTLWPKVWANELGRGLERCFSKETAGFLFALTTGHREKLSDALDSALTATGLRHIVTASGLHVHLLFSALCLLPGNRRWRRLALLPLLLAFAALAGFTPSICRAAMMEAILLLGPLFDREPDGLTSLSLALALLLGQNPYAAASVSLQLSFAAMFGLLTVCPALRRRLRERKDQPRLHKLKNSLIVTLGANVFTLPLVLYYFGTVSLLAPLSNLVVLWLLPLLLPLALLCSLGGWLCLPVGLALAGPAGLLAELMIRLIRALAAFPWSTLPEGVPFLAWIGLGYAVGGILLFGRSSRRQTAAALVLWLAMLPAAGWTAELAKASASPVGLAAALLDVGQGQCLVLAGEMETAVVDCGSTGTRAGDCLEQTLAQLGRERIDHLILTHYDWDHTSGVAQLLLEGRVGRLWLPQPLPEDEERAAQLEELAALMGVPVEWVNEETKLLLDNATLCLLPLETEEYRGTAVLATLGKFDLLVTGDADIQGEEALLRNGALPQVEVLIAGHHGSAGSTGEMLLEAVQPQLILISVGENGYGHPTRAALDRCRETGAELRRTDRNGTIWIQVLNSGGEAGKELDAADGLW